MKQAEAFLKELGITESDSFLEDDKGSDESFKQVAILKKQIESRAVYLLGMREHGAKELKTKLLTKFPETPELLAECQEVSGLVSGLIDEVLLHCQKNNWQSDERYIEQSVRNWAEKGSGPVKIRQKLRVASNREDLISLYLDWSDDEWFEIAQTALIKKYGATYAECERNEQAKRMRFLQSRGFTPNIIWKAFRI